jgi:hypothetical protein
VPSTVPRSFEVSSVHAGLAGLDAGRLQPPPPVGAGVGVGLGPGTGVGVGLGVGFGVGRMIGIARGATLGLGLGVAFVGRASSIAWQPTTASTPAPRRMKRPRAAPMQTSKLRSYMSNIGLTSA